MQAHQNISPLIMPQNRPNHVNRAAFLKASMRKQPTLKRHIDHARALWRPRLAGKKPAPPPVRPFPGHVRVCFAWVKARFGNREIPPLRRVFNPPIGVEIGAPEIQRPVVKGILHEEQAIASARGAFQSLFQGILHEFHPKPVPLERRLDPVHQVEVAAPGALHLLPFQVNPKDARRCHARRVRAKIRPNKPTSL